MDFSKALRMKEWAQAKALLTAADVRTKDARGDLPLHRVCMSNKVPHSLAMQILELNLEATCEKNDDGCLPLHLAAEHDISAKFVKLLLEAHPLSIREEDACGDLPLQHGLDNNVAPLLLRVLRQRSGLAIVIECCDWAAFNEPGLVTAQSCSVKHDDGDLPLHQALRNKAATHLVERLLKAFPGAAAVVGYNGDLPLQVAADKGAVSEVVEMLLEANPHAATEIRPGTSFNRKSTLPSCVQPTSAPPSGKPSSQKKQFNVSKLPFLTDQHKAHRRPISRWSLDASNVRTSAWMLDHKPTWEGDKRSGGCALADMFRSGCRSRHSNHLKPSTESTGEDCSKLITLVAASDKGWNGWLPLHVAAIHNVDPELVMALLNVYPEAGVETDDDGWTPLHHAAWNNSDLLLLHKLLAAQPDALQYATHAGDLPLHCALSNKSAPQLTAMLLSAYTAAACAKSGHGDTPLHLAAFNNAQPELVAKLLEIYPEAASEQDNDGNIPLHLAAWGNAGRELVEQLLQQYPAGVRLANADGNLPLHLAAFTNASPKLAAHLLDAHPRAARAKNLDGNTPLHMAVWRNVDLDLSKNLIAAYPEAVRKTNADGDLPLHLAARKHLKSESDTPSGIATQLLVVYPEATRIKDRDGVLPRDYVALVTRQWSRADREALVDRLQALARAEEVAAGKARREKAALALARSNELSQRKVLRATFKKASTFTNVSQNTRLSEVAQQPRKSEVLSPELVAWADEDTPPSEIATVGESRVDSEETESKGEGKKRKKKKKKKKGKKKDATETDGDGDKGDSSEAQDN